MARVAGLAGANGVSVVRQAKAFESAASQLFTEVAAGASVRGASVMASRVSFNEDELETLWGLPWLPQLIYMRVIRPNMDYVTGVVGIRTSRTKRISYQTIREQVEVHEKQGRNGSDQPSMSALRHAVNTLINVGLITRVSGHGDRYACLVFRCLLADVDLSVRNKYDRGTTGSTTEVRQEVQQEVQQSKDKHEPSIGAGLSDEKNGSATAPTTDQSGEVQQTNPEKYDTPPDTDLNTDTTPRPPARETLLPADFQIDETVRTRLVMGGVRLEVAAFFLEEFRAANESSGYVSMSWPAEFVKYCKRWEWRYDKEQGGSNETSERNSQQRQSRATRVHEREKRLFREAVIREQGAEDLHASESSVRPQVVVPYRGRGDS